MYWIRKNNIICKEVSVSKRNIQAVFTNKAQSRCDSIPKTKNDAQSLFTDINVYLWTMPCLYPEGKRAFLCGGRGSPAISFTASQNICWFCTKHMKATLSLTTEDEHPLPLQILLGTLTWRQMCWLPPQRGPIMICRSVDLNNLSQLYSSVQLWDVWLIPTCPHDSRQKNSAPCLNIYYIIYMKYIGGDACWI